MSKYCGYKDGDKVQFKNEVKHSRFPQYYPAPGTVGEVMSGRARTGELFVQWPEGSTSGNDLWWVSVESVEYWKPWDDDDDDDYYAF